MSDREAVAHFCPLLSNFYFNADGTMVGAKNIVVDLSRFDARKKIIGHAKIIKPPTNALISAKRAIRPP